MGPIGSEGPFTRKDANWQDGRNGPRDGVVDLDPDEFSDLDPDDPNPKSPWRDDERDQSGSIEGPPSKSRSSNKSG
jgi:hypothetical protein